MEQDMKRMYYVTNHPYGKSDSGIGYKIYMQIKMFELAGFHVQGSENFVTDGLLYKVLSFLPFVNCRYQYNNFSNVNDVNFIYIRYFMSDLKLVRWIKAVKRKNKKTVVFVEIPTYPYDSELSWINPSVYKDRLTRRFMFKYVDRVVTFSDDNRIYDVPTIRISNGVDIHRIAPRVSLKVEGINLIAVAALRFWHGYDRLIEGLRQYYMDGGKETFKIHIVGDARGNVRKNYSKLISKYDLQDNIFLYGSLQGEELDSIYNKCELGVDSLGRHRSKVYYNSSLKGKEYLAKGLPIISGVKTELDYDNSFPYYMRVPADDSPVDFNKVSEFYHQTYDNEDAEVVSQRVRNYCESHFSFESVFRPVVQEAESMVSVKKAIHHAKKVNRRIGLHK